MLAIVDYFDYATSKHTLGLNQCPAKALKHLCEPTNGFDTKLSVRFLRAIGVFPIGSLVLLSNRNIGMVVGHNHNAANLPVVNAFYCAQKRQYLAPKTINLKHNNDKLKVLRPVQADDYHIDQSKLISA